MDDKSSFLEWLKTTRRFRPNTIRMYRSHLKKLPEITLDMPLLEICGTINTTLSQHPSKEAKGAFKSYVDFLFNQASKTTITPTSFEELRMKKNSILANIELPRGTTRKDLDIEKYYIGKVKLLSALKLMSKITRQTTLLIYDSGVRANELLKNDWKNLTPTEIYIPRQISKTKRDRVIEWLMPETREIINQNKQPTGKISDWLGQYKPYWQALTAKNLGDYTFNPHSLRHTILSDLAGMGWEIGALQRRAGHTNINQTQQYISWAGHKEERTLLNKWCEQRGIKLKEIIET